MKRAIQLLSWGRNTLDSFIAELNLSKGEQTIEAYEYDVGRFLEYVTIDRGIKRVSSLRPLHVVEYLSKCKKDGKSSASVNRYYMAIRSYCRFLRRNKFVNADLTQDITPPRSHQKAPRVPTQEEIVAILNRPNITTESGLRDRAILELLYSSGLRASELCCLHLHHVTENGVMVSCGKRGKTRTVPITDSAFRWIKQYIDEYRGTEKGTLFQTRMGKTIRRQLLCALVGYYAKQAGIEGVTTHTMRHACATHLLDEGADLRLIQEVLGHSSIASTQRYTHLSSRKMEQMFKQFHPRKQDAIGSI
jgi:integrase/recombinase XerD